MTSLTNQELDEIVDIAKKVIKLRPKGGRKHESEFDELTWLMSPEKCISLTSEIRRLRKAVTILSNELKMAANGCENETCKRQSAKALIKSKSILEGKDE